MRLDHIAYRVADRHKTVEFFKKAFDYKVQTEFDIKFGDGTTARCYALEPPEKPSEDVQRYSWKFRWQHWLNEPDEPSVAYHMAPEIFVSDGDPDSIVGQWVANETELAESIILHIKLTPLRRKCKNGWRKGMPSLQSAKPLTCPGLTQVFTKPSELTGVIYEFIERGEHGFCQENVKDLMESTRDVDNRVVVDHK